MRTYLDSFRAVGRSYGLVPLLWAVNLAAAAALALPLAAELEDSLAGKPSASTMMYGFDYSWWSPWHDRQAGFASSFAPDVAGEGFAFKTLDLLLRGALPARLLARDGAEPGKYDPDAVILAWAFGYLVLQTFLAGGVIGVLRSSQGHWTLRGLLHGSGFYFGRLVRVTLVALLLQLVLFAAYAPLAGWAETRAREALDETTAHAWLFGRSGGLLLLLLVVHMLSSYAKIIVVLEERSSALLAWLSSLLFCLGHPLRTLGHYLAIVATGLVAFLAWSGLDGRWATSGYRTQLVALLLAQGLVLGGIALRLALLGGQVAVYRRHGSD